ncbi:helicase-related protein [Flexivirga sp. B27]
MNLQDAYATRKFVVDRLKGDLLGDELDAELSERPMTRFVVGVLYPQVDSTGPAATSDSPENDDIDKSSDGDAGSPTTEGADDPQVSLARVRNPRTMGLTFAAAETATNVQVTVEASRYIRSDTPTGKERWIRETITAGPIQLDVTTPGAIREQVVDGVRLEMHRVVREPRDGAVPITLALINDETAPRSERDAKCWFNPTITVTAPAGELVARPESVIAGLDDLEVASQRLLFSDVQSYAIGHGCGVGWIDDVTSIHTSFIPSHEVLLSSPAGPDGIDLRMVHLSESGDLADLTSLVSAYRHWIDGLDDDGLSDEDFSAALDRHKDEAGQAADRMSDGISLLLSDPNVRRAFDLMNLAMAQQRSRQDHHRNGQIGDPAQSAVEAASWRPFQIAFILVNLRGLADPESPDREIADLLWFPTGGGKTEAYLGLIAIAILLRRLRNSSDGGVSVIMRYTLRLLTLQQYERATGLICALEELRRKHLPAARPISIGLWVGRKSTPNSLADASQALKHQKSGRVDDADDASDPVQLRQCPWCGTELTHKNYDVADGRMNVVCPHVGCQFGGGLPVHIVDEDVYRERPSLVIGTVDKFAMMAWKREVGNLFGSAGATADGATNSPPDLIVQDELHLISGPLGTMVGLYEAAVDAACTRPSKPKLVASTATIRRATDQVRAVFDREARQFPPPGRTYRDSYFSVEAPRDKKGSREYVGVLGAGTSQTTLMVRVYASLLQSAAMVPEDSATKDLYWTLLGYFNALRLLGGAYMQVIDDVPAEMKVIAGRRHEDQRTIDDPREMTSRKKSTEIPHELKIMERKRGETDCADVVLATNMISVGVDVDRLGVMAVMGQPQTTSEYIQATSRVGRRDPGLVVAVLNGARSRDLSHYENFAGYHRMLYRHVEATGATPFAPRARDRGLHGVLVSMARMTIAAAADSRAAGHAEDWPEALRKCVDQIVERASALAAATKDVPEDQHPDRVRNELETLVNTWADDLEVDHYEGWFDRAKGALLVEASKAVVRNDDERVEFPVEDPPWPTLTSMRDVDAESSLFLVRSRRSSRG